MVICSLPLSYYNAPLQVQRCHFGASCWQDVVLLTVQFFRLTKNKPTIKYEHLTIVSTKSSVQTDPLRAVRTQVHCQLNWSESGAFPKHIHMQKTTKWTENERRRRVSFLRLPERATGLTPDSICLLNREDERNRLENRRKEWNCLYNARFPLNPYVTCEVWMKLRALNFNGLKQWCNLLSVNLVLSISSHPLSICELSPLRLQHTSDAPCTCVCFSLHYFISNMDRTCGGRGHPACHWLVRFPLAFDWLLMTSSRRDAVRRDAWLLPTQSELTRSSTLVKS